MPGFNHTYGIKWPENRLLRLLSYPKTWRKKLQETPPHCGSRLRSCEQEDHLAPVKARCSRLNAIICRTKGGCLPGQQTRQRGRSLPHSRHMLQWDVEGCQRNRQGIFHLSIYWLIVNTTKENIATEKCILTWYHTQETSWQDRLHIINIFNVWEYIMQNRCYLKRKRTELTNGHPRDDLTDTPIQVQEHPEIVGFGCGLLEKFLISTREDGERCLRR